MLKRTLAVLALVVLAGMQTGCCGRWFYYPWPCAVRYKAPSCGKLYWSDWYSEPPKCQDPCSACGDYTGCGCCQRYWGQPHGFPSEGEVIYGDGPGAMDSGEEPAELVPTPAGAYSQSQPTAIVRTAAKPTAGAPPTGNH